LNYPLAVALDASGSLFIADQYNSVIRKVDTNGMIATVAGNGAAGFSGDGGTATNASLNDPYGVAVDGSGNLFIADANNNRVRRVDTNGIITTFAGKGAVGYNAGSYSGDGGAATNATLNDPIGLAVDGFGNLFIGDSSNNRVRKVSTNGIITTVAGNGNGDYSGDNGRATSAGVWNPWGVVVDSVGNLFIADDWNQRIRKVSTNGIITTVAGNGTAGYSGDGGAATAASLNYPSGVAVDALGNLFIADFDNSCIRKVSKGIITTVAGNGDYGYSGDGGRATSAKLGYPFGVAMDASGNLLIADQYNQRIRKVTNPAGLSN